MISAVCVCVGCVELDRHAVVLSTVLTSAVLTAGKKRSNMILIEGIGHVFNDIVYVSHSS